MKKIFIASVFSFALTNTAQAIPNLWYSSFSHGTVENIIENSKGQTFNVSCTDGDNRHYVEFGSGNTRYTNSDDNLDMQVLFDNGEVYYIPSGDVLESPPTLTEQNWNLFIYNLPKAKRFDVYINNKKKGTFIPKNSKAIKDIDCSIR